MISARELMIRVGRVGRGGVRRCRPHGMPQSPIGVPSKADGLSRACVLSAREKSSAGNPMIRVSSHAENHLFFSERCPSSGIAVRSSSMTYTSGKIIPFVLAVFGATGSLAHATSSIMIQGIQAERASGFGERELPSKFDSFGV